MEAESARRRKACHQKTGERDSQVKGEAQRERKGKDGTREKKKEGSGKNRKLTIIMEFLNNHFTKGKTYIKIHSPLKTPELCPPPTPRGNTQCGTVRGWRVATPSEPEEGEVTCTRECSGAENPSRF